MKLLIDARSKVMFIGEVIEFGFYDDIEKWKIDNMYAIDNNYRLIDNVQPPIEVIPLKYFYINNEFVKDPNYVDENYIIKRMSQLESELSIAIESSIENDFRLCKLELFV